MDFAKIRSFVGIAVAVNDTIPFRCPQVDDDNQDEENLKQAKLFWKLTSSTFAGLFLPTNSAEVLGEVFELVIDSLRFLCCPLRTTTSNKRSSVTSVVSFSVLIALDASLDSMIEQSRAKLRVEPTATTFGKEFPLSLAGARVYKKIAKDLAHALLFAESANGYVSAETNHALEHGKANSSLQKELEKITLI